MKLLRYTIIILCSINLVHAHERTTEDVCADTLDSIRQACEQFTQKKSQSGNFVHSHNQNEKQAIQERMNQLEEQARALQKEYLTTLSQLERAFTEQKLALERDYLQNLQKISAEIQELVKKSKELQ